MDFERRDAATDVARLTIARFPLILSVLLVHSSAKVAGNLGEQALQTAPIATVTMRFLSDEVGRFRVPLLLLIAGYFFFLGYGGTFAEFRRKVTRRSRSLLAPFLFWNLVALAVYFVAALYVPDRNQMRTVVTDLNPLQLADRFFGVTGYPINYPLWFLRNLIVLTLLTPLLYPLLRRVGTPLVAGMLAAWALGVLPVDPWHLLHSLLFFLVGGWLAQRTISPFSLDRYGPVLATTAVVLAAFATWQSFRPDPLALRDWAERGVLLAGIPGFLWVTRPIANGALRGLALAAGNAAFFVFAFHEPTMTVVHFVTFRNLGGLGELGALSAYLLLPALIIAMAFAARKVMQTLSPTVLAFATGAREGQPTEGPRSIPSSVSITSSAEYLSSPDLTKRAS